MVGFWDVTPYSLVDIFRYFRARPNFKSGWKGKADGEIMLIYRNGKERTDEDGEPRGRSDEEYFGGHGMLNVEESREKGGKE